MKLNIEDIKAYIEFDLVPYDSNILILINVIPWILGLVCGLLSVYRLFTTITIILLNLGIAVVCICYIRRKTIFYQHLLYGLCGLSLSVILLFGSYKYAYVDKVPNLFIFILYILIYLISIAIYYIIATKMISSGYYRGVHIPSKSSKSNITLSVLGGLMLYLLGRVFLMVLNQDIRVIVLSVLLFVASLMTCNILKHLLKCYYQKKYKIDNSLENHFKVKK